MNFFSRVIAEVNAIVASRDSQVADLQSSQEKVDKEMLDMVNKLQKQVSRKNRDVQVGRETDRSVDII